LIDSGEIEACLTDSGVHFDTTLPDFTTKILKIMFDIGDLLNFMDYMFIRKVDMAW